MDEHRAVQATSDWMSVVRDDESRRPDAYLHDPHAHLLAGGRAVAEVAYLREIGAPFGVVIGRGRFGDAVIGRALGDGVRQIVELAAGSGTRAWRLGLPGDVSWYEVDLTGQLAAKEAALENASVTARCRRRSVDADLRTDWAAALANAGHDAAQPTVWIAEGLFYYLFRDDALAILRTVTGLSAAGSHLVFDVPHTDFARDPDKAALMTYLVEYGSPFVGAAEHPDELLPVGAWKSEAYRSPDLVAGRCPWVPPMPERLAADHRDVWYAHAWR
ncbi:class I SAM-dependent methyltransferase [Yinghuangia soli]|uniref:S-adenosyl-L-methionine-dependent methyltransferase n=1 Tax=Yinghuangia soli TaxID=2908204 RepID=A0AA41PWV7_9ACTN|nr:SAM-dependent methyltransferase [Yinghuangia soli]MCF2527350.1 SAM-dependent methyltransferase [Yinghuangia soli]